jgi:hypothetical protein
MHGHITPIAEHHITAQVLPIERAGQLRLGAAFMELEANPAEPILLNII